MKIIVLAGGQGTKMWPYSTEDKPKQFQAVIGEQTLFQTTVYGLLEGFNLEDIIISTKKKYVDFVLTQTPEILRKNIIAEPDAKKNQGPGTLYSAMKTDYMYPGEPFFVVQSDCLREPNHKFLEMIREVDKFVSTHKKITTGVRNPLYPVMGVDYFQLSKQIDSEGNLEIFEVEKFLGRLPTFEETKTMVDNYHVVIHCNHLSWYSDLLLEATKEFHNDWYEKMIEIRDTFGKNNEEELTEKLYSEIPNPGNIEEVTSHIFEESGAVFMLPFRWTDVGTWDSVYEYFSQGKSLNYKDGDILDIDTTNSLIKGRKGKLIATLGVDNLVIVDTDEALFVCRKDRSGDVKEILQRLEKGV